MKRKSIDNHLSFDEEFSNIIKSGLKGAGIGLFAGVIGGIFLGESLNDYFDALKQAPAVIQYAVDITSSFICGEIGAGIGAAIGQAPGSYKLFCKS